MPLRIHNTLTRQKEDFRPLHGRRVNMFVCGITPYDHVHMGHAKTYVTFDLVSRYLRYKGYRLFYLQNVTDIEDRLIARMLETKRDWKDLVSEFIDEYMMVMDELNITSVNHYAWATDYMPEIIEQIKGLIEKGYAYEVEGDVYYDVKKFGGWGKLSGMVMEELRPGARVEVDKKKRNPADFALWKSQKPGEPAWDSPWGKGRPGWHIEDTAITMDHFGPQYDLHGGATELMFPHHEAEIAQAEALTGKSPFVKYWIHGGMLMVDGEEMHKSLGNFWAVVDALKHFDGEVIRFFLINAHYRSPIDFTVDGLEEAKRSYERLLDTYQILSQVSKAGPDSPQVSDGELDKAGGVMREKFEEAMDDDFNTREAIAAVFIFVTKTNKLLESGISAAAAKHALAMLDELGNVLGFFQKMKRTKAESIDAVLDMLVQIRDEARDRKDFATSDLIRERLMKLGITLEDAKGGVRWKWKTTK